MKKKKCKFQDDRGRGVRFSNLLYIMNLNKLKK